MSPIYPGRPDSLTELLRNGARDLIRQAVEAELGAMLSEYENLKLINGRQAIVRNGYLPERTIQTGVGDVRIKVSKVRDRNGSGIHSRSHLQINHLKRRFKTASSPPIGCFIHITLWIGTIDRPNVLKLKAHNPDS